MLNNRWCSWQGRRLISYSYRQHSWRCLFTDNALGVRYFIPVSRHNLFETYTVVPKNTDDDEGDVKSGFRIQIRIVFGRWIGIRIHIRIITVAFLRGKCFSSMTIIPKMFAYRWRSWRMTCSWGWRGRGRQSWRCRWAPWWRYCRTSGPGGSQAAPGCEGTTAPEQQKKI